MSREATETSTGQTGARPGTHRSTKAELIEDLGEAFRLAQNRSQAFDELVAKRLGIGLTDMRCLDLIQREQPMGAGALAEAAGLTTGAITALVDRLVRRGLVRREGDPSDRRRVLVSLTEAAEREVWGIYGPLKREWERVLNRYTAKELRRFLELMSSGEEVGQRQLEHLRALGVTRLPSWRADFPEAERQPPRSRRAPDG
jgi:DNA-binding MarR family transcriptional regulator